MLTIYPDWSESSLAACRNHAPYAELRLRWVHRHFVGVSCSTDSNDISQSLTSPVMINFRSFFFQFMVVKLDIQKSIWIFKNRYSIP